MILLAIAAYSTKTHDYTDKTVHDYEDITESLCLTPDGGEAIDLAHLGQYVSPDSNTLILYCRLPEMTKDTTLIYRSKDVYTSLFSG